MKNKTGVLSTAFTRGPIRGCIFIEADMTSELANLIYCTPGIMKRGGKPIIKFVPIEDRIKTITLPKDLELRFTVGQWIQVTKGTYKGDIGYVKELKAWGGVQLILVPRLRLPVATSTKIQGKRQRTVSPPDLALFDTSTIEKFYHISPTQKGPDTYFFNGCTFEHGLLVKDFDSYSVSSLPVFISSDSKFFFLNSRHPIILKAQFPPPIEWHFQLDDLVDIIEGPHKGKLGHIKLILPEHLDVDLSAGEGLARLPWHNVHKHFVMGDFVKIVGGMHEGRTGWIQSVTDCTVSIVQKGDTTYVDNCPVMEVCFLLSL